MLASVDGRLSAVKLEWDPRPCVCVVIAAGGYPGDYATGKVITGFESVPSDVVVFHAGTRKDGDFIVTSGGRVLGVTALGRDIAGAISHVYAGVEKISFDGMQCRRDIGKKALDRI